MLLIGSSGGWGAKERIQLGGVTDRSLANSLILQSCHIKERAAGWGVIISCHDDRVVWMLVTRGPDVDSTHANHVGV